MFKPSNPRQARVAIIGLGYVGLPLAVEFGKQLDTIGFDIAVSRVGELRRGEDHTREISSGELRNAKGLHFTTVVEDLADCSVFIVTVPTPIDQYRRPDLGPLLAASKTVGVVLKPGDVVVYESTVYPGATEEDCVPVLEQVSGLKYNVDFFVGYSPERINPGDRQHRLPNIRKVTSGSTPEASDFIDQLYNLIIVAGTHKAPSIRVAEAAKVIENTQRDLNIALVNELALIFERMNIDTEDVLAAARTKWNFLDFRPGLVGGHCIGVDPYYLTHKAQALGIHPEVILSGRRINDRLGGHIADRVAMLMTTAGINLVGSRVLVLGLAFKENCPDIRNTRVVDLIRGLARYNLAVDVIDPWVNPANALREYDLQLLEHAEQGTYDAVILAVSHEQFRALGRDVRKLGRETCVIFDVKHVLPRDVVTARL